MGRNLQTIYEYFSDYTEEQVNNVIYGLSVDEILVIKSRFGNDLHNPSSQSDWGKENSNKYYGSIIPKMKRRLAKLLEQEKAVDDYQAYLLQLIKEGKNNREICEIFNISFNQLYDELLKLKTKGVKYSRKYYSDGSIKYNKIKKLKKLNENVNKTIITDNQENNMKFLLISDLHFGNEFENLGLIDRAYNYCIKNGINIILCGGDFIDGSFSKSPQKITDLYDQIEYFIKNYPQDKNILTFGVAGDHDFSTLKRASLDIIEICNNRRHDIIIGGYNNAEINIKNNKIHLFHNMLGGRMHSAQAPIILCGHLHKYMTQQKNNSLYITLPTLSNINQQMPSALELDLSFSKGYISSAVIKHLYFGTQDFVLSESEFNLLNERNSNNNEIKNVEGYRQNLDAEKILKKTNN
ncbi:MAG: metallophosphoesterase family protein [Bacilli bacterium]|nr:metallophosphoesterase family protein [Bacilli bacterium]